jgi:PKD repeat protein
MNQTLVLLSCLILGFASLAQAKTIYVKSTYVGGGSDGTEAKPYVTIAAALPGAVSGDTVFIKNGIYPENNLTVAAGVTVKGESQTGVLVSASGSDRIFNVVGTLSTLSVNGNINGDGLRCSGAAARVEYCSIYSCADNGIEVDNGTTITIFACSIYSNTNNGIYFGEDTTFTVERCEIAYNSNGILSYSSNTKTLHVLSCTIHDNRARGIFVEEGGYIGIYWCKIWQNANEGIYVARHVLGCRIDSCLLLDNGGEANIYLFPYHPGVVLSCDVVNVTIVKGRKDGIRIEAGYWGHPYNTVSTVNANIRNCIVWGNTGTEINVVGAGTKNCYVNFSTVEGGYAGSFNRSDNPLFADYAGNNFHLSASSPCIDQGSNAYVALTTDADQSPRQVDGNGSGTVEVDMGCYEFPAARILTIAGNPPGIGNPTPAYGAGPGAVNGTSVTASAGTSPTAVVDGSRYRYTGYTVSGSGQSNGTAASLTFPITSDTTITWQWLKQWRCVQSSLPAGMVAAAESWTDEGTSFTTATAPALATVGGTNHYFHGWQKGGVRLLNGQGQPVNPAVVADVRALQDLQALYLPTTAVAAFSATTAVTGVAPFTVGFTDASTGLLDTWTWDFGDGTVVSNPAAPVTHQYTAPGVYTVKLTVSGQDGANTDTMTMENLVTVHERVVAGFEATPLSGPSPLAVAFTDTSSGSIATRTWNFGDGSTVVNPAAPVTHVYSTPGQYSVSLSLAGPGGNAVESKQNLVRVHARAVASFRATTPTEGTVPLTVGFTDESSGDITTREWEFGDGSPVVTNPSGPIEHTYASPGAYTVKLTVSGDGGTSVKEQFGMILVGGSGTDYDEDGIPNSEEIGADSANPLDLDGDGIPDYLDTQYDLNGADPDANGNGMPDLLETGMVAPAVGDVRVTVGGVATDLAVVGTGPVKVRVAEVRGLAGLAGEVRISSAASGWSQILPLADKGGGVYEAEWTTAGRPGGPDHRIEARLWCRQAGSDFDNPAAASGWGPGESDTRARSAGGYLHVQGGPAKAAILSSPLPVAQHPTLSLKAKGTNTTSGRIQFLAWPDGVAATAPSLPFTLPTPVSGEPGEVTVDLAALALDPTRDWRVRVEFDTAAGQSSCGVLVDHVRVFSGAWNPALPIGGMDRDGLPVDQDFPDGTTAADARVMLLDGANPDYTNQPYAQVATNLFKDRVRLVNSRLRFLGEDLVCGTLEIDGPSKLELGAGVKRVTVDHLVLHGGIELLAGSRPELHIRRSLVADGTLIGKPDSFLRIVSALPGDLLGGVTLVECAHKVVPPQPLFFSPTHPEANRDFLSPVFVWRALPPPYTGMGGFRHRFGANPGNDPSAFALQPFHTNAVTVPVLTPLVLHLAGRGSTDREPDSFLSLARRQLADQAPVVHTVANGATEPDPDTFIRPLVGDLTYHEWLDGPGRSAATFTFSIANTASGSLRWRWWLDKVPDTTLGREHPVTPHPTVALTALRDGRWWFHVAAEDRVGHIGPTAHRRISVGSPYDFDFDGTLDGPNDLDEDADLLPDSKELRTDIHDPDSDGDGILDGMEDLDRNGVVDAGETDPANPDSDGDGVPDGLDHYPLDPTRQFDSDQDGVADGEDSRPFHPMGKVTGLIATGSGSTRTLSFTVSGAPADGVNVTVWYRAGAGGVWTPVNGSITGAITGLSNGTKTLTWNAAVDLVATTEEVEVKVVPVDQAVEGVPTTAAAGTIDLSGIPRVTVASVGGGGSQLGATVPVSATITADGAGPFRVILQYANGPGAAWVTGSFSPSSANFNKDAARSINWLVPTGLAGDAIRLRLIPYAASTGLAGRPYELAGTYWVDNNALPTLTVQSGFTGRAGGVVPVTLRVTDPNSDPVTITLIEVKKPGAADFAASGYFEGAEQPLTSSPTGVDHTLWWHCDLDIPTTADGARTVEVRVTGTDEANETTKQSVTAASAAFDIFNDNGRPTVSSISVTLPPAPPQPTGVITVTFNATDPDGDKVRPGVFQYRKYNGSTPVGDWLTIDPAALTWADGTSATVGMTAASLMQVKWDTRIGTNSLQGQASTVRIRVSLEDVREKGGSASDFAETWAGMAWDPDTTALRSLVCDVAGGSVRTHGAGLGWPVQAASSLAVGLTAAELPDLLYCPTGQPLLAAYRHKDATQEYALLDGFKRSDGTWATGPDYAFDLLGVNGLFRIPGIPPSPDRYWVCGVGSQFSPYFQGVPELSVRSFADGFFDVQLDGTASEMSYPCPARQPAGLWYDSVAKVVWILDGSDGTLVEWSETSKAEVGRWRLGQAGSFALTHDGSRFWTGTRGTGSTTVTKLMPVNASRFSNTSISMAVNNTNLPPDAGNLRLVWDGTQLRATWELQPGETSSGTKVEWYRNGESTPFRTDTAAGIDTNKVSVLTAAHVPGGAFVRGDSYHFVVKPRDGIQDGPAASSLEVTKCFIGEIQRVRIPNVAPVLAVGSVAVTPGSGVTVGSTLEVNISGTPADADNDAVTLHRQWFVNQDGATYDIPGATGATLVISDYPSLLRKYRSVGCRVTPDDGQPENNLGSPVAGNAVMIGNSPPVVAGGPTGPILLREGEAYDFTPATLGFTISDPDGDAVSYRYAYSFGGTTTPSGALGLAEPVNQDLDVTVTAESGYETAKETAPPTTQFQFTVRIADRTIEVQAPATALGAVGSLIEIPVGVMHSFGKPCLFEPPSGLPAGALWVDAPGGGKVLRWTPDYGQFGDFPVTFRAVDESHASLAAEMTTTIAVTNEPPVADQLRIELTPERGLRATWRYADTEGRPQSGTLVRWYRLDGSTPVEIGQSSDAALDAGSNAEWPAPLAGAVRDKVFFFTVTPSDAIRTGSIADSRNAASGSNGQESVVVYPNTLPELAASSVAIANIQSGQPVRIGSTLGCTVEPAATDIDGDTPAYRHQWFKGAPGGGTALTGATQSTLVLASQPLARGDSVYCRVTPDDGQASGNLGEPQDSAALQIENSAPVLATSSVSIANNEEGQPIRMGSTLVCRVLPAATDADGDTPSYGYQWFKGTPANAIPLAGATQATLVLASQPLIKFDKVFCRVIPSDGQLSNSQGIPHDSQVLTIQNIAPVLATGSVAIANTQSGQPVRIGSTLSCTVQPAATDIDGDTVVYRYQWFKGTPGSGTALTEATQPTLVLSSQALARGDSIYCRVTPDDGQTSDNLGVPQNSAALVIGNTPPSLAASSVGIANVQSGEPVRIGSTLSCTVQPAGTDIDGDTTVYRYQWFKGMPGSGTSLTGATQPALVLASQSLKRGDPVYCRATPDDGQSSDNLGAPQNSAAIIIQNSPPVIAGGPSGAVVLDEGEPYDLDPLKHGFTITDPDAGDTVSFTYSHPGFGTATAPTGTLGLTETTGQDLVVNVAAISSFDPPDTSGPSATITYQVRIRDRSVTPAVVATANGYVGQRLQIPVSATHSLGKGYVLSVAGTLPPGASLTPAGGSNKVFDWTPTSGQLGQYSIKLRATDAAYAQLFAEITVVVTVRDGASDTDRDGMPLEFEQRIIDASPMDGINAPEDVLPGDDFDKDGLPNLIEFAVGGDPTVPDPSRAPKGGMATVGGQKFLTLSFRRLQSNTSLLYQVEESTDLRTWFPLSVAANMVGAPIEQGDGTELVTVRASAPLATGGARYLRLAVARDTDLDNDGMDDAIEQRIADAKAGDAITGPEHVTGSGDFDGDGVPDILESAFGMDPTVNGQRERLPAAGRATIGGQTYLTLTYRRLKGTQPFHLLVQESGDLKIWSDLDQAALVVGPAVDMGDGTERITIRCARPGFATFLRVAASAN